MNNLTETLNFFDYLKTLNNGKTVFVKSATKWQFTVRPMLRDNGYIKLIHGKYAVVKNIPTSLEEFIATNLGFTLNKLTASLPEKTYQDVRTVADDFYVADTQARACKATLHCKQHNIPYSKPFHKEGAYVRAQYPRHALESVGQIFINGESVKPVTQTSTTVNVVVDTQKKVIQDLQTEVATLKTRSTSWRNRAHEAEEAFEASKAQHTSLVKILNETKEDLTQAREENVNLNSLLEKGKKFFTNLF